MANNTDNTNNITLTNPVTRERALKRAEEELALRGKGAIISPSMSEEDITARFSLRPKSIKERAIEELIRRGEVQGVGPTAPLTFPPDPTPIKRTPSQMIPVAASIIGEQVLPQLLPGGKAAQLGMRALGSGLGAAGGLAAREFLSGRTPKLGDLFTEFGVGAVSSPVSTFVGKGIGKFAKGRFIEEALFGKILRKRLVKRAREINRVMSRFGGRPLTSQITDSSLLDVAHNVTESSFSTAGRFSDLLKNNALATENFGKSIVRQFLRGNVTSEEIGDQFLRVMGAKKKFNKEIGRGIYRGIDNMLDNRATIDIEAIEKSVARFPRLRRYFDQFIERNGIKTFTEPRRSIDISGVPSDLIGKFEAPPTTPLSSITGRVEAARKRFISFFDAHALRSDFLTFIRMKQELGQATAKEVAAAKVLQGTIFSEMEKAATRNGVFKQWRQADAFYKGFIDTFGDEFILSLANQRPSVIGRRLASLETVEDVRVIRDAVEPKTFKAIQGSFINWLFSLESSQAGRLTTAMSELTSREISGHALKGILQTASKREVVKELLGSKVLHNLDLLADTLISQQIKQGSGLGRMATQLIQARGAVGIIAGIGTAAATGSLSAGAGTGALVFGTLTLTPFGLMKLLDSERGIKLLLEGAKVRAPNEVARHATKVAIFLGIPVEPETKEIR